MAEIWMTKNSDGCFSPMDDAEKEKFDKYAVGSTFLADVKFKRNGKHHRLGMALLRYVYDNQDKYNSFEVFLTEVKILTGYVDTHISLSGMVMFTPKSIAFDKMDEIEFSAWKGSALKAVFENFIPLMGEIDQERVINHLLANS